MLGLGLNIFTLAIRRYFGGGGGQFAGSSLNLDFTSGNQSLDPRVTFSRASNATVTGPDGTLGYAPHNLLTFSEQFDNAAWNPGGVLVTANSVSSPNGATTADTANESTTTGLHQFQQTGFSYTSGLSYTQSVFAKADTATVVQMLFLSTAFGTNAFANYNLATGVLGAVGSSATATISDAGNGWYRLTLTATASSTASGNSGFIFLCDNNTNAVRSPSYTGTNKQLYVWGAQLELGSTATTYNPTTVKNLLGFTEHFDNAAWTKSNSFVQTNLLLQSEAFDSASWVNLSTTVTANAAIAPDGTLTAETLSEGTSTALHYVQQLNFSYVSGVTYTQSVYVKADTATVIQMVGQSVAFGVNSFANYDLVNGVLGTVGSAATATITSVGNDWYRITLTTTAIATTTQATGLITLCNNNTTAVRFPSYTGSDKQLFLWGAQLVQGTTPGDYKATTSAAAAVGYPDIYGQPFAQKLVEDTATSNKYTFLTTTVIAGTTYTGSCFVRAAERSTCQLTFSTALFGAGQFANFNLATGEIVGTPTGGTATIESFSNGWYRISFTATCTTSGVAACPLVLTTTPAATRLVSYTGDGTSGIYIFGAQLSDSASVDPYVYQPVAAPTSTAYYGPRFDYDPVTLAPKGLLIEEQRTNLVLRSEEFENAYWTKQGAVSVNTTVAPDGATTADTLTDTAATGAFNAYVNATPQVGALTFSVYLKAGSLGFGYAQIATDGTTKRFSVLINLSTGAFATSISSGSPVSTSYAIADAGNGWWRLSVTATNTSGNVFVYAGLADSASPTWSFGQAQYTGTGTGNIFLWGAQLEAGSFATSYIPTVASQVTRAADSASMIGNNFARWYNQTEGTFFAEASTPNIANNPAIYSAASDANNTISSFAASQFHLRVFVNGAPQADIDAGTFTDNVYGKVAGAYKVNDFAASVDGGAVVTDSSGTLPNPTFLYIGANSSATYRAQHIKRIAYYNRRLANTELQAITS